MSVATPSVVAPAQVIVEAVSKRYRGVDAVDRVSIIEQGGIVAVLGPNGAGKTTLLRCLATVLAPDAGRILIDGLDPTSERERIEIRRRIGYLPQQLTLAERVSAFDVVDYVGVLKQLGDERRRRRQAYEALDRVGLVDVVGERTDRLSSGMRRRVGLAQAIIGSPTLLLLDEPAAGLDPDERLRLRGILSERRHTATTIVSTHLTDEAAFADTIVVLLDGRVRFAGPPRRLAALARGQAWRCPGLPPPGVRASWQLPDGGFRCVGQPPPGADLVEPTLEDGYLLAIDR